MTIVTPTAEPGAGGGGPLDVALLNRLAGEFFASLGGAGRPAAAPASGAAAQSGAIASGPPTLAPALDLPGPQPHSLPQGGVPVPTPPQAPRPVPDLPAAYAPALPLIGTPTAAAASPFHFVGDAASAGPGRSAPLPPPPTSDRVSAQSFGLPGAEDLRALLVTPPRGATGIAPPATPVAASGFYFLAPAATSTVPAARPPLDVHAVRRDFPLLAERVNCKPLVWLDNAATTQKPQSVIDRLAHFYTHENSNIHRAAHALAARATDAYEAARGKVQRFLGAASADEIIFVRGATEAINLVAQSWGRKHVGAGDEIIVSHLEHHANIVPWQQLAAEKGAVLKVIPVDDDGQVRLDEYAKLLGPRTRLVAVTQVSNALGTVVPVREIVAMAHAAGACTLVDGAQSVSHMAVDVQQIGADFFVFSGHKVFGPTGIGVVYGRRAVLEEMPPWQGGGNMIADVTFERTLFQPPPNKFEAGTGNIADAVGLGAAIDYVQRLGMAHIAAYEHGLLDYATRGLKTIPGLRLIGTAPDKASVLSFVLAGYRTEEVGQALNAEGIAVRSGHHCAQPILRRFGLEATVRPSLAFYNTCDEVDQLVSVVRRLANRR